MTKDEFIVICCSCLVVLALVVPDVLAQPPGAGTFLVASDDWCPYVCARNGKLSDGYLVDVLRLAIKPDAYQIELVLMPFRRALDEAESGTIQGVLTPPQDARLLISEPLGYAHPCFYTRASSSWTYTGIDALAHQTLGVIQNYNYDNGDLFAYIRKNRANRQLIDEARGDFGGISNIRKLAAGRVTVIVEDEAVMPILLAGADAPSQIRLAGCLAYYEPLTLGLNRDDPRSIRFTETLNAAIEKLEATGSLAELRRRYKLSNPPGKEKKR